MDWVLAPFRWIGHSFVTVCGVLYLGTLSTIAMLLVIGSLSAIQVMELLSEGGKNRTFATVRDAMERVEDRRRAILENLDNRDKIGTISRRIDVQRDVLTDYLAEKSGGFFNLVNPLGEDLLNTKEYYLLKSDCLSTGPRIVHCTTLEEYERLIGQRDQLFQIGAHEDFSKLSDEAYTQIQGLTEQEELAPFFIPLTFFESAPMFGGFIKLPPQVLVLVLTVVMGILGSLIALTWSFLRHDSNSTLRRFLLLPLVGAMSAFIVFVLFKAGQMTITAGNSSETLSPFFVSFVGIISGLLSERAYSRIADVGNNFFSTDRDEPRWGVRLAEAMEAAGASSKDLAKFSGTSEEEADNIVAQRTMATRQQQQLIAAYLRKDLRELFTDVAPAGPSTKPKNALEVPDLVGKDEGSAASELAALGLRLGARGETVSAGTPVGSVVAQSPASGEVVAAGTAVDITVSAAAPG